ncbi:AIM24 family protein [Sneathiella sp. HT1-7]|uniref:AIM24 family protein n=1 Tax=Sneathiella sp. HT1-7 TaxID=2887192 RepID=UPI001D150604|nr:AIM24 family protein [Sneathiella sp. HT1-7]MCC3304573.1 AIM24 family protein [Sneathiella sp. HT1-7]
MVWRNNGVFHRLFWLIVLTGTVPAAVSTTLPPTHWCLNFSDLSALFALPSVGCFGGSSIAQDYLGAPFSWFYLALFCVGLLVAVLQRKVVFAAALLPLVLLFASPVSELSVYPEEQLTPDYFEPKSRQTTTTIKATVKEVLPDYDGQTAESDARYANVVRFLSSVESDLTGYNNALKNISRLEKRLENARKGASEAGDFLKKAQAAVDKIKRMGGFFKKTLEKAQELLDFAKKNNTDTKSRVKRIEKEITQLTGESKILFASYIANLNDLNTEVTRSLSMGPNQHIRFWTLLISAASFLSLLLFAFGSRIRSPEFAISCLFVILVAFNPMARTAAGISFSQGLFSLLLASYALVLFIVTAISLRLFALAILQNIPIFAQFDRKKSASYALFTALRWIPIGICIVLGLWLSLQIDTRAQDAVYGVECTKEGTGMFECAIPTTETLVVRGENPNLERDIYNAVDIAFRNQEIQLERMLAEYRKLAKTSPKQIPAFVDKEFTSVYPDGNTLTKNVPSLKPPECKLHQVDCHITRKVKISIIDAYDFTRDRQRNRLNELTSDFASLTGEKADKRLREIELYLSTTLDATKRSVRNIIADVFWTVRSLNLLATLILIVAAVKSFAYIFSRVAFKSESGKALPIENLGLGKEQDASSPPDILSGYDPEYIFRPDDNGKYYIKPALSPSGSSQGIAWPQPHKAILRRLFSGTYKMVKVNPHEDLSDMISIQTSQGRQFLEWNLKPGERVYFSQGNLAAFSETIRLETHISLSLTAMAFGRMFFSVAEGPGKLVLRTFGKPEVYTSKDNSRAIDPLRFIGWSDQAHFHINSSSSLENIYFHSAQIRFSHGGAAIGDVSENGKRGAGAIRFIPPVFLPF